MFDIILYYQAESLLKKARKHQTSIVTAESCTGGLIAGLLTEVPGSSDVILGGLITYANEAKSHWVGVESSLLKKHGAVSKETAEAMAKGAMEQGQTLVAPDKPVISVAVSGIAGPRGGSTEKPVGTLHIACKHSYGLAPHEHHVFAGDRHEIRMATVEQALKLLDKTIDMAITEYN